MANSTLILPGLCCLCCVVCLIILLVVVFNRCQKGRVESFITSTPTKCTDTAPNQCSTPECNANTTYPGTEKGCVVYKNAKTGELESTKCLRFNPTCCETGNHSQYPGVCPSDLPGCCVGVDSGTFWPAPPATSAPAATTPAATTPAH